MCYNRKGERYCLKTQQKNYGYGGILPSGGNTVIKTALLFNHNNDYLLLYHELLL